MPAKAKAARAGAAKAPSRAASAAVARADLRGWDTPGKQNWQILQFVCASLAAPCNWQDCQGPVLRADGLRHRELVAGGGREAGGEEQLLKKYHLFLRCQLLSFSLGTMKLYAFLREFKKSCKVSVYLRTSASVQPTTSPPNVYS